MAETIRTILQELYELAPELKARESELAPLILKLVQAKPDIKPSPAFVAELKLKLVNREKELMMQSQENNNLSVWIKLASFMRQPLILSGAAVIVFVLILVSYMPVVMKRFNKTAQPFSQSVTRLQAGAFGQLLATSEGAPALGLGSGSPQASSQPPLANTSLSVSESTAKAAPVGFGGGVSADRAMIYPYPYPAYTYTYTGEETTDLPNQVNVLRRVKNTGFPVTSGFFKSFDIGNFKLDSFASANLSQVTLTEDKNFGLMITVDFMEGLVNIYENWRRWPQPFNDCKDEACYKSLQMKIENVPADDELISLANSWLADHGIKVSDYGKPYVQNDWRIYYAQAEDKSIAYVPDVIQVMYPVQVNNNQVYEYGGNNLGLGVNINVRYNRVSGLWNLISQQYQSSAYEAETDWDVLVKYATSGMQGYPMPLASPEIDASNNQKVAFSLGTPTIGYLRYWHYQNNDNQELFLPSLVFPVATQTEGYAFMPRNIVVPLVKEFLQSNDYGGPIRIMPMTEPGAGVSGSSGSAEPAIVDAPPAVVEPTPAVLPNQ